MKELVKISGLTVRFYTYEGVVLALDNLDLGIDQRETLGLVGETGCGKTMTALSILRLIPPPGKIECGSILFNADGGMEAVDLLKISEDEIRAIRGSRIAMIFQEPGAALNPVFTIGDQIAEVILLHRREEMVRQALKTVVGLRRTKVADLFARCSNLPGQSRRGCTMIWPGTRNRYRRRMHRPHPPVAPASVAHQQ